jgi:hypothetical protein
MPDKNVHIIRLTDEVLAGGQFDSETVNKGTPLGGQNLNETGEAVNGFQNKTIEGIDALDVSPERKAQLKTQVFDLTNRAQTQAQRSRIGAVGDFVRAKAPIVGGAALGIANIALDYASDTASITGNVQAGNNLGQLQATASTGLALGATLLTGNPLIIGAAIGYKALQQSKENRKFIDHLVQDKHRAAYYADKLIDEKTRRSR